MRKHGRCVKKNLDLEKINFNVTHDKNGFGEVKNNVKTKNI